MRHAEVPIFRVPDRRGLDAGGERRAGGRGASLDGETLVRRELDGLDVEIVTNHDFHGPSSKSFHAGLNSLPPEVDAVVAILPDMVHVSAETLGRVHAAAGTSSEPLIAAPPILFRRSLFDELLAWDGDGEGCGKPVVKAYVGETTFVDWPVEMLDDVDTPEDFARVTA